MTVLTIIVPVYKTDETLFCRCVESLIKVKDVPVEVILVDDGSPDNCGKICDEFAQKDSRIKVIHQKNLGVSVARNVGLDAAQGEWICFVDADDWVEPNYYSILSPYFDSNVDVYLFAYHENLHNKKKMKFTPELADMDFQTLYCLPIFDSPYTMLFGAPWTKLFKRIFLEKNEIHFEPDIKRRQDTIFALDYLGASPVIKCISSTFYNYFVHNNSVSRKFNPQILTSTVVYLRQVEKRLLKQNAILDSISRVNTLYAYLLVSDIFIMYIFHPQNRDGYFKRRKDFLHLIKSESVKTAFKYVDYKLLRREKKLIICLTKMRMFFILNILYKLRYRLKCGKQA